MASESQSSLCNFKQDGVHPYMLEIGTMWQIGVLTGKPRTFLVQNCHVWRFGTTKIRRELCKLHIPVLVLTLPKSGFSTGIYSIHKGPGWSWLEPQEEMGKMRTVSRLKRQFSNCTCLTWKKGKDPHPQDKIQHLDFTKDPRPLYYKTSPCVFHHKKCP